ncbi:MAG: 4-alpha-glucanotransferase [Cyanobium sp.]
MSGAEAGPAAPRDCGVLLHPTALPGSPVCGTLGAAARQWVALLGRERVGVWQLLPLSPPDGTGSPYSSPSGSALNPWLVDVDDLVAAGWLQPADRDSLPGAFVAGSAAADPRLDPLLATQRATALGRLLRLRWPDQPETERRSFRQWRRRQAHWLRDHGLFMVLRRLEQGRPWWQWPAPLARRQPEALRRLEQERGDELLEEALLQWCCERQWRRLRAEAAAQRLRLVGDLPFYVAHDSAEVWARPGLFSLQPDGSLLEQSGVPPDYFSATGQLWGTPVYRWGRHRLSRFQWWLQRLERQLELFDLVRLDHFRALESYWSVPGGETTAEHGRWLPSPGRALLRRLWWRCLRRGWLLSGGRLPLIAEDLGVITPPVERLRDRFALPGMKILQFAFDGNDDNPYLPVNFAGSRWVVYTGTHDNATSLGWWRSLDDASRQRLEAAVGAAVTAPGWQLLELALASPAELAVVPLQDLLELGDEARFNVPGTVEGNWRWRLDRPIEALAGPLQGYGAMAARYGRAPAAGPG